MGSYTGPTHRLTDDSPVNMDPVTMQELSAVLKGMTANKAPGPDNIPSEALGGQQKLPLLNLFNNALLVGVVPQDWSTAVVAEVHKRGTMADPNNYRPISLLSTSYKPFCADPPRTVENGHRRQAKLYSIRLQSHKVELTGHPRSAPSHRKCQKTRVNLVRPTLGLDPSV